MIEVLDPTVEVLTQPIKFVARPGSLAGKRFDGVVESPAKLVDVVAAGLVARAQDQLAAGVVGPGARHLRVLPPGDEALAQLESEVARPLEAVVEDAAGRH